MTLQDGQPRMGPRREHRCGPRRPDPPPRLTRPTRPGPRGTRHPALPAVAPTGETHHSCPTAVADDQRHLALGTGLHDLLEPPQPAARTNLKQGKPTHDLEKNHAHRGHEARRTRGRHVTNRLPHPKDKTPKAEPNPREQTILTNRGWAGLDPAPPACQRPQAVEAAFTSLISVPPLLGFNDGPDIRP
jgi:hypothetical protein